MDIVSFAQEHPVWTIFALIVAIVIVGWSFAWAAGNELKEEAERVHFPKHRRLTPDALEQFEAKQRSANPTSVDTVDASTHAVAKFSLRSIYVGVIGAMVMIALLAGLWVISRAYRLMNGACDDPSCDGYLGPPEPPVITDDTIRSRRACVECGMPHHDEVTFAEIESLNRLTSQTFS